MTPQEYLHSVIVKLQKEVNDMKTANQKYIAANTHLRGGLTKIAAFDDTIANKKYTETGKASWFDEPNSVLIARETLKTCP